MMHKLPSGAELLVALLPFEEAWSVTQAVLKEIENVKVDLKGLDFEQLKTIDDIKAADVMVLKGPICALLSSKSVLDAVKLCFTRCAYNKIKIDDKTTFKSPEARGDFILAAFYVLKENVSPFFGSLASFLGAN